MRVRCNMCDRVFDSEDNLPLLAKWPDGTVTLYSPLCDVEKVFHGCPNCMTDEYLMDLDE